MTHYVIINHSWRGIATHDVYFDEHAFGPVHPVTLVNTFICPKGQNEFEIEFSSVKVRRK